MPVELSNFIWLSDIAVNVDSWLDSTIINSRSVCLDYLFVSEESHQFQLLGSHIIWYHFLLYMPLGELLLSSKPNSSVGKLLGFELHMLDVIYVIKDTCLNL